METEMTPDGARDSLAALADSSDAAVRGAFPRMPVWHALMLALVGPGIVAAEVTDGWLRVLVVGAVIGAVVMLWVITRSRQQVRPARPAPTRARFVASFTLVFVLMGLYILTGEAADEFNPWVVAVVSYSATVLVLLTIGRRAETITRSTAAGGSRTTR